MFKSGLVSISFRKFSIDKIISIVKQAKLECIEWGGDVHVPHGDVKTAAEVRKKCDDAGIKLPSYGSYYRAGETENNPEFSDVLASAIELGVQTIRVWAGKKGSADASPEYRQQVVDDLTRCGRLAAKENISISLEYHGGTLTDTDESAVKLMQELSGANVLLYWQPAVNKTVEYRLKSLQNILPQLTHIHIFHWVPTADHYERRPLSEGAAEWQKYLKLASAVQGDHCVMMEFVKDDSEQQFYDDAEALNKLLAEYN